MTHHLIHTLLLLLLAFGPAHPACAQQGATPSTLQGWADKLKKFGSTLPQEQVFVHMDNTCYFLGDTIYYKAYMRRSDTGAPSRISGVLYVELFNQDGYLVERQQLEMTNGQGCGSFCLPDTLYGGYYEMRAYTRWQLNWGVCEHPHTKQAERWFFSKQMCKDFYRDYDKLYSRVFPVYDKPLMPGDYTPDMTLRPMSRVFKTKEKVTVAHVSFYPEGGHLLAGAPCTVAFEANDDDGQHMSGTLTVKDSGGQVVAEAKAERRGRGSFTLTPAAGQTYTATFAWDGGNAAQKLPKVESQGCALVATQSASTLSLALHTSGQPADRPLGVTVMHQGVPIDFQETEAGAQHTLSFDTSAWPTGVMQLTVFDTQGTVYADRLVFVRQPDFQPATVSISGASDEYEPFAPIQLSLQGMPGSTVSVAVRDAAHSDRLYDNADILSEMLLSSQVKGFVENPRYFFEANDEQRARDLDLLLMIQGWRRFDWYTMTAPGAFVLSHKPERTPLMTGEVNNYTAKRPKDRLDLFEETVGKMDTESKDKQKKAIEQGKKALGQTDAAGGLDSGDEVGEDCFDKDFKEPDNKVRDRFHQHESNLKREVRVHAEFVKPGASEGVLGEVDTQKGMFNIDSPRFFGQCFFFLAAADVSNWTEETAAKHTWIMNGEDEAERVNYPDFYVKLNPVYPRFVKPYGWYHCNTMPTSAKVTLEGGVQKATDGTVTIGTVTVRVKRNINRGFRPTKPAFVIDAYTAFNEVCDAGFNTGVYLGYIDFAECLARTYIGDMGQERQYSIINRFETLTDSYNMSQANRDKYNHLPRLDKVYIYTDYCPRREGERDYVQSNQPEVHVDLRLLPNEGLRSTYRDRRYILNGFSVDEDFYQPDYSKKPLPDTKDYRRTLYWNPNLTLDGQGAAEVKCFNNSSRTKVAVSVEGMAQDGTPQTGTLMPKDTH